MHEEAEDSMSLCVGEPDASFDEEPSARDAIPATGPELGRRRAKAAHLYRRAHARGVCYVAAGRKPSENTKTS